MINVSSEEANKALQDKANEVETEEVEEVLAKEKKIEDKIRNNDSLSGYFMRVKIMFSLIRDYWSGNYPQVPWKIVAAIVGALLYVLIPLDLIPDFIPIAGFIDDAGVLAACLKLVSDDLVAYEKWKQLEK